ncbi:hypothetical protein HN51_060009 [Arachis hypogaea]
MITCSFSSSRTSSSITSKLSSSSSAWPSQSNTPRYMRSRLTLKKVNAAINDKGQKKLDVLSNHVFVKALGVPWIKREYQTV